MLRQIVLVCVLFLLPGVAWGEQKQFNAAALEFFEKEVRPLLAKRCYRCHSGKSKRVRGGLRLDSRAAVLVGGDTGPAAVAGKPGKSLLIDAIHYGDIYQMPPRAKLPGKEIATLTKWVKMGLPWPSEKVAASGPKDEFDLKERKADHWCWQPVRAVEQPRVKERKWPISPIDYFILAKLEEKDLEPAAPAERRTLIRRAYFDVIGLPPTPAQVKAFVEDKSPKAFERVVDGLLHSPHFGERWGRHWLDLVRYAESRGHEFDYVAPNAYQYRDYVIRALNADVPYDQFVTEHIAGDLLKEPRRHPTEGFNESILGTGFWFLGEWVHSPVDIRQDELDRYDNMIDVMSKTFLGLTVSCARCHDHKFDAISQKDYYALSGYLQSSGYRLARFDTIEHNERVARELHEIRRRADAKLREELVEAVLPTIKNLPAYLLASRAVVAGGPKSKGLIQRIAAERKLKPDRLAAWVEHLQAAAKDASDPLHVWAKLSSAQSAARLEQTLQSLAKESQAKRSGDDEGANVVVDYGKTDMLFQDGVAFGVEPMRRGEILLSDDPRRPIRGVVQHGAARRDARWDVLRLAEGQQKDPGRLGSYTRSGQTLRTPTFTVESGLAHVLVRGAGHIYAAVDSHAVIQGPLHGSLVSSFDTKGELRWVSQRLHDYKGHRVHLEITSRGGEMQVLKVIDSARPGSLPAERPNRLLAGVLMSREIDSAEALAKAYRQWFLEAAKRFAAGKVDEDTAQLAGWMGRHFDLFGSPEVLVKSARGFVEKMNLVAKRIEPESRLAMAMMEGSGEDEFLLVRGNYKTRGSPAPRRLLTALGGKHRPGRGSGRLELAKQMVDPANPLTARVMVNRIWHHLFGRGLVASVDNFGVLGQRPSHPKLLDHLARQFVEEGWSIKKLIRSILLSRTYQMSSKPNSAAVEIDPKNELLHRASIRRLQGEVIRDQALMLSGTLDRELYGPSVPTYLTPFMQGRGRPRSGPIDGQGRRTIYLAIRRNFLSPMMLAFDAPIPFSTMGRRNVSNVPAQALIMMNDPFVIERARLWGQRLLAMPDKTAAERIVRMYEEAFARPPSDAEVSAAMEFIDRQGKEYGLPPANRVHDLRVWADLCHAMMNVKEFIFIH